MRKSWKPQVRSFFANRAPFWVIFGICILVICCFLYSVQNYKFLILTAAAYTGSVIFAFYYVKRWNKGGFEKITIDTGERIIIFDDKCFIPFDDIVNIEYIIENNPNTPLIFRSDLYDNGRIDLLKINATLIIQTKDCKIIRYAIQNKPASKGILKMLNETGFQIYTADERTLNIALTVRIIIVIICLILLIYINFLK